MKVVRRPVLLNAEVLESQRTVYTMYGNVLADAGDFIITGIDGEQHPVSSEHFKMLYEVIDDGAPEENYEYFDDYGVSGISMLEQIRFLTRLAEARKKELIADDLYTARKEAAIAAVAPLQDGFHYEAESLENQRTIHTRPVVIPDEAGDFTITGVDGEQHRVSREHFALMYEAELEKRDMALEKLKAAEDEVQEYTKRYKDALSAYDKVAEDRDAKAAQIEELASVSKQFRKKADEQANEQAAKIRELEQDLRLLKSDKAENGAILDRLNSERMTKFTCEDGAIPLENISVGAIRMCDGSLKMIENGEQVFNVISFQAEITSANGFDYVIRRRRHIAPAQGLSTIDTNKN